MKWRWDVTGKYLAAMVVMAPILMALVANLEYNWLAWVKNLILAEVRKLRFSVDAKKAKTRVARYGHGVFLLDFSQKGRRKLLR